MNLEAEILSEHSKRVINRIVDFIGNDPERFAELMKLFFGNEYRITQRAAWAVSNVFKRYPNMVVPYLDKMLHLLADTQNIAVKRNTVRILQDLEIPEELCGTAFEVCSRLLISPSETIAVRAFSITVLVNLTIRFPELKNETRVLIEAAIQEGASAGMLSRANKELKRLGKLTK